MSTIVKNTVHLLLQLCQIGHCHTEQFNCGVADGGLGEFGWPFLLSF
jgi:hypothetical protein